MVLARASIRLSHVLAPAFILGRFVSQAVLHLRPVSALVMDHATPLEFALARLATYRATVVYNALAPIHCKSAVTPPRRFARARPATYPTLPTLPVLLVLEAQATLALELAFAPLAHHLQCVNVLLLTLVRLAKWLAPMVARTTVFVSLTAFALVMRALSATTALCHVLSRTLLFATITAPALKFLRLQSAPVKRYGENLIAECSAQEPRGARLAATTAHVMRLLQVCRASAVWAGRVKIVLSTTTLSVPRTVLLSRLQPLWLSSSYGVQKTSICPPITP